MGSMPRVAMSASAPPRSSQPPANDVRIRATRLVATNPSRSPESAPVAIEPTRSVR
jgi:hypothetical protein